MFAEVVKLYVNMEELNSTGILDIDNDPVDGSIGEIIFVNMSNVKEFYEVKGYKSEREAESDVVENIEEQIRDYGVLSLLDIKVEELEE